MQVYITWILWEIVTIILFSVKAGFDQAPITFLQDQGVVRSMALPVGKSTQAFPHFHLFSGVNFFVLCPLLGVKLQGKNESCTLKHKKWHTFIYLHQTAALKPTLFFSYQKTLSCRIYWFLLTVTQSQPTRNVEFFSAQEAIASRIGDLMESHEQRQRQEAWHPWEPTVNLLFWGVSYHPYFRA